MKQQRRSKNFPSSKTLLRCETNFSLLKQLLKDLNSHIEGPQVMTLLKKSQFDPTVDEASAVTKNCWTELPLFTFFSFSFFFSQLTAFSF